MTVMGAIRVLIPIGIVVLAAFLLRIVNLKREFRGFQIVAVYLSRRWAFLRSPRCHLECNYCNCVCCGKADFMPDYEKRLGE